jgi:sphingolipid delta-4 desaturase
LLNLKNCIYARVQNQIFSTPIKINLILESAKAMLAKYPQIKKLFGAEPKTMIHHTSNCHFANFFCHFSWYGWHGVLVVSLIAAYCFGAFFNHATFVIIHETSHNAVFNRKIFNRFAACLVDLVNVFPSAEGFRVYHVRHHAHQGDYEFDADLPYKHEAKTIGNNPLLQDYLVAIFPDSTRIETL